MSDIDEVKKRIDIVDVVSEFVKLKKTGRNFKGLCPFHSEKTPSFIVSQERQIWHCFGGCGEGGDVFRFLMKVENIEFGEALRILAKRVGYNLAPLRQGFAGQGNIKEKIYEINSIASEYYQYLLTDHLVGKRALNYVLDRGITKGSIKLFGLGYAPNSWDGIYRYLVIKKKYNPEDVEKAGMILKGRGYYDRFRGRLMFTLRDARGNVVGFAGRILDKEAKEASPKATHLGGQAKYINTSETPVYVKGDTLYGLDVTKEEIKKEKFCVVVEGEIDAIRSYQSGVKNVVAIKGTALTDGQLRLLKRYTENLTISLDADFAGDAAARRGIEIADSLGFNIKVSELIKGKDPDEAVGFGVWKESVEKAVPIYDYFIDSAFKRNDSSSVFGKKKIGDELFPIFSKISNDIVKAHYTKVLADRLGVSEEVVENGMAKALKKEELGIFKREEAGVESKKTREEIIEEHFLSLILQCEEAKNYLSSEKMERAEDYFASTPLKRVFVFLKDYVLVNKSFEIGEFVKTVPEELSSIIDRLYITDLGKEFEKELDKEREIFKTCLLLEELYLRRKLAEVSKKISALEEKGEGAGGLSDEFLRLSNRLSEIVKNG